MITQNMASTSGVWCTFPSISAAAPATAAAGATLANQKLRSSADQSEAGTGIAPAAAMAGAAAEIDRKVHHAPLVLAIFWVIIYSIS